MEFFGAADQQVEELSDQVKMVIWDLDDTLWRGTLSEGPVRLEPGAATIVRELNRRGIVNAICSKNDEGPVRERLRAEQLWDEFVFRRVDWSPKGPRIARIIEDAQLRAVNVLFIDDHPLNLEEARHFSPGLQTAGPELVPRLLELPQLRGKDDSELTRLAQYRVLDRKVADRQASDWDNEDFLRQCDIEASVSDDCAPVTDRLFELVHRTNQLNFTKRRPEEDEFRRMLAEPTVETGFVEVRDRYGEYGICGFYSLEDGRLLDFLFSCRVLDMGVEQWLYERLGRPAVDISGNVASSLERKVDWITEVPPEVDRSDRSPSPNVRRDAERVLMVGGCDLEATVQFLSGPVATDFSRNGPTGAVVHVEHTDILRQARAGLTEEQKVVIEHLPFLDVEAFDSPAVVRPDFDVLVYSVLMDYTQGRYRHRTTGLIVPWHQLDQDVTDPSSWDAIESRYHDVAINRSFLEWFAAEFEALGPLSPSGLDANIRWLAGSLAPDARLVLINGAEVPLDNPNEPRREVRHRTMNAALDAVASTLARTSVCDVRTFVRTPDDLAGDLRHYRRHCYFALAQAIRSSGALQVEVRPDTPWTTFRRKARRAYVRTRVRAARTFHRVRRAPSSSRR